MSNVLIHGFVSVKSDGADAAKTQPSHWNAGHKFTGGSNGQVLIRDTGDATYGAGWGNLFLDLANTIEQRNGVNAQIARVYNTYTDSSNFERIALSWTANIAALSTEKAGTGTARELRFGTNDTGRWSIGATTGHLLSLAATVAFGYGNGGTVTQATSKSTGVTLNTVTGEITMDAAALAADTTVAFTLTNSTIAVGDYVLVQHISAGTQAAYITTGLAAAGSAMINVHNATPGALSEAIVLKFMVLKSATA